MFRHAVWKFALVAATLFPLRIGYSQTAGNAAELYRQAFDAVPSSPQMLDALNADHPTPAESKMALAEGARALLLAHQATSIPTCDWAIDTSGRTKVNLAFLKQARKLHMLLLLQFISQSASGNYPAAAVTLTDMMVLGRRLEGVDLFVMKLTGSAIEDRAITSAAESFPQFNADSLRLIDETFRKLPAPASLDKTIATETRLYGQDIPPKALATPKAVEVKDEVLRTMFAAALASPKGGEAHFKSTQDPVGGKPFGYRALDGGYELSSQGQYKDKPITLVVGKAEKP